MSGAHTPAALARVSAPTARRFTGMWFSCRAEALPPRKYTEAWFSDVAAALQGRESLAMALLVASPMIRIGCSGWQYKHWRGDFYPADQSASRWLSHYVGTF